MTPDDARLTGLIEGLTAQSWGGIAGIGTLYLIGKDYQVREAFPMVGEVAGKQATRSRSRMLRSGDLLATVMTGWSAGADGAYTVCEHYVEPGKVETYTLNIPPPPQPVWTDADDLTAKEVVTEFQSIWKIDDL